VPLTWWADSTHAKEGQARHRMRQLEPFFSARNGALAIYRVDYDNSGFVSERVIQTLGREVRPVRWSDVRSLSPEIRDAYQKLEAAWRERAGGGAPEGRSRRPKVRKPKGFWAELGQGMAFLLAASALCIAAVSVGVVYRTLNPSPEKTAHETAPDPARFDRVTMTVRNDTGGCDRVQLNNRTGRTAFQGTVDCAEAARQAAAAAHK
jgi:hypothetical protein